MTRTCFIRTSGISQRVDLCALFLQYFFSNGKRSRARAQRNKAMDEYISVNETLKYC